MLLYVIKQWKEKKITVMLLILGFLVGNLVLSVGTSVAVENVKRSSAKVNSGLSK